MSGSVPVALCLAGLSPAVITETLDGLATRRRDPVVPREVHVVTTHGGLEQVHVLAGPGGRPLDDIRDGADSRAAGIELVEVPVVPLGAAARLLGYGDLALERFAEELLH